MLTGDTPQVISPTGAWHGPLLFPGDVGTSLQWQPDAEWRQENQCVPASTSTTTTTTSTPGTPPPEVNGSTTLPPPAVNGSTTIATTTTVTVAGISATQAPAAQTAGTSTNASTSLALTGANSDAVALVGAALLVAGLVLVVSARRRTVAAAVDNGPEPHRPTWFDPDDRW